MASGPSIPWGSSQASLDMAAIVKKMVADELERQAPRYAYGNVTAFDRSTNLALVLMTGDTVPIEVSFNDNKQPYLNATVKIDMNSPRPFIVEQMNQEYYNPETLGRVAESTITGGGLITWDSSSKILKWNQPFYCFGVGVSGYIYNGYWIIPVPVGGVQIPLWNDRFTHGVTTAAGGIYLDHGQTLYYRLPLRTAKGTSYNVNGVEANFIVMGGSGLGQYDTIERADVRANWVRIASVANIGNTITGSSAVKLGNGTQYDYRKFITMTNYKTYGDPTNFHNYHYYKQGNTVYLGGLGLPIAGGTGAVSVGVLPVGYRPLRQLIFPVMTRDGAMDLRVLMDGTILVQWNPPDAGQWMSLDSVRFQAEG